jgi:hypothetical protein
MRSSSELQGPQRAFPHFGHMQYIFMEMIRWIWEWPFSFMTDVRNFPCRVFSHAMVTSQSSRAVFLQHGVQMVSNVIELWRGITINLMCGWPCIVIQCG